MDKKKKNDYEIIYDEFDTDNPKPKRKPKTRFFTWHRILPAAVISTSAIIIGLGLILLQVPERRSISPTSTAALPLPTWTPLVITVPVLMTAPPDTPMPSPQATVIARWITDVEWSPNGTLAVSLWDAGRASVQIRPLAFADSLYASEEDIITIPAGSDFVSNLALSPDGTRVALGGDTMLRVFDVRTGAAQTIPDGSGRPSFSPDGGTLAFATGGYGDNHTVRLLDPAGADIATLLGMPRSWSVAFSPDGQTLAVSDWDRISLWHTNDWQSPFLIESVNEGWMRDVTFSPDGRHLAVASGDKLAVFDLESLGQTGYSLFSPLGDIWSVAFSPDGTRLAAAVGDHASGMAQIWDVATGQPLIELRGHRHRVSGIAYSPDGRRIITSSYDGSLRLWDAVTGQELSLLQL